MPPRIFVHGTVSYCWATPAILGHLDCFWTLGRNATRPLRV